MNRKQRVLNYLRQRRKAIVAAAASVIVGYAAKNGLDLTGDQATWLTGVLTTISVYLVPNQD
jgi:uncharacterized membrane protein (DUF441 family)